MKKALLLILILFTGAITTKASHIAGADLTYRWIGGNDWELTFTFYRDCSGISVDASALIKIKSASCGQNFSVNLQPVAGTGQEITPSCPTQTTTCSSGSLYGIREHVYKGTVTLQPCADWTFYYCTCCRNPPIQTISSPSSVGMYIGATLNNTVAATGSGNKNSSPTFSNKPNTILCVNQSFCYNHGAIDLDGDSLVYSLVSPYDEGPSGSGCSGNGGVFVQYTGAYSAQQPLLSSPLVSLDPVTGDICMKPTQQIVTIMAVLVKEYRNNILIGSVFRDMQVNVIACTNNLPTLPGIDTAATSYNPLDTSYTWAMCLGETVNFDLYANDPDNNPPYNNLTLTYNNGIPSGLWNVTGPNSPNAVGHFSWTPVFSDVSNVPHCFTVQVRDAACPYYGLQTFSYCITVKGLEVSLSQDSLLCKGESYTITAIVDTNAINFNWTVDGTPVTPFNNTTYVFNSTNWSVGTHTIALIADDGSSTVCPGFDQIVVNVVYMPQPHIGNDTILCQGQPITLDAGQGGWFIWSPGGQSTQTISPTVDGNYSVIVDGGANTRCKSYDTIAVDFVPMPVLDLGPDTCVTGPIILDAGSTGLGYQYSWNTSATTQTIMAGTSGTYSVLVTSLTGSVCYKKDTIDIDVIPTPIFDLGNDTTICSHQTVTLTGPTNFAYQYLWIPDNFNTPSITTNIAGPHVLQVFGCQTVSDTLNITLKLCELTVPNVITPNGDTHNDMFVITNLENYPNSRMTIFNRWGKKIYEDSNYQNNWDGGDYHDGVYYFILIANDGTPEGIEYHGTITIIGKE